MTAPSHITDTVGSANATTFNLTIPATAAINDIALIFRAGNTSAATLNAIAGWTLITSEVIGTTRSEVWWRKLVSGDPGSTVAIAASATTKVSAVMSIARDVHLTTPIHAFNSNSTSADTDAIYTGPTVVNTQPALVYEYFFERSSTPSTSSTISGATKEAEIYMTGGSAVASVMAVDGYFATGGTRGGAIITWSTTNTTKGGIAVALLSEDAGGTPAGGTRRRWNGTAFKTGGTYRRWNGTAFKSGGTLRRWNGTAFKP